jgi:hypothetical protein
MQLEASNTYLEFAQSNLVVLKFDKEYVFLWERMYEIVSY